MKKEMKKIVAAAAFALGAMTASAQVQNYALQFEATANAVANLGRVNALKDAQSYTLQLWFNPEVWTQKASLVRCGTFSIRLGVDHALVFNDGTHSFSVTSGQIGANKWTHLTVRCGAGGTSVTINNGQTFTSATALTLPAADKSLWLGGNFAGRIDEVRLWAGELPEDYNSYWQNTLNELNPSYDSLLAYWKMDQEQCVNVVDYRGTSHGTLGAGVEKTPVTDNSLFKYRVNLAYGNVQRFFDRKIDARHYSLSNRIAIIAAKLDPSTGNVKLYNPSYHAEMGSARQLAEYQGREGVADVSAGAITSPGDVFGNVTAHAFEAWIYPETLGGTIVGKSTAFALELTPGGKLAVTLNGETKTADNLTVEVGRWTHVATSASGTDVTVYVGTRSQTLSFASAAIASNASVAIGKDFNGKIDDVMFWNASRTAGDVAADAERMPLADADHAVAGALYSSMTAAYNFDSAAEPGFDRFSVQNWFRTMRDYTRGMRGVRFFLTVNAENFDGCLANGTLRNKAIADMSELVKIDEFDGIDLDFEWPNNGWGNIATVVEGIRQNLPAGKMITVSPHQVYYNYPAARMDAVDGFNFQNYGPNNKRLFTPEGFQEGANNFLKQGFPREKIIMSYATTTTGGMNEGGSRVANTNPAFYPAGYRSIYKEGETLPSDNRITSAAGDCYYFLTGFDQTVYRAQYIVDNDLGGIFYWDLGNDLAATHSASLARGASYAVNSNVEMLVTEVDHAAVAPENDPNGPIATADPDDQGGFDTAEAAEAIAAALQTYAARAGYAATGSEQRTNLLHLINMAHLGMTDGATLESARQEYLATAPDAIEIPATGKKYYIVGLNANDDTRRYLHVDEGALAVTSYEPQALTANYEWTATALTDTTYTLSCNGHYVTISSEAVGLTTNAAEATPIELTAGNAHGRIQLVAGGNYVQSHYVEQNVPTSMMLTPNDVANNEATNPKKWSSQWLIVEVEPELLAPYAVNCEHPDGGIVYGDAVIGHAGSYYLDPLAYEMPAAVQTNRTKSNVSINHATTTIDVAYSGLDASKVYRLRNSDRDVYMTMQDNGNFVPAELNANNASQVFGLVATEAGKWGLSVQNTFVGATPDQNGVQITKASVPGSYFVVEKEGRYAFDRTKDVQSTWGDGSKALSAPNNNTQIISTWATGVNYSWWYAEAVEEFEVATVGGYAAVCLPFAVSTTAEVYTANVDNNIVILTPTEKTILAHTPVIVYEENAASIVFTVEDRDDIATAYAANALVGRYPGDATDGYALSMRNGEPKFVSGAAAGNNTAIIPADLATAEVLPIELGNDPATIISNIEPAGENKPRVIYDLQGRRVASPARGLYIINGRKVFVK